LKWPTDAANALAWECGYGVLVVVGGRVTPAVIQGLSYIGSLVETKAPEGPYFEATMIHHTACGSGLLADPQLRHGFAQRTGYDEDALADLPCSTQPRRSANAIGKEAGDTVHVRIDERIA
jgi:carbonic anhydrase